MWVQEDMEELGVPSWPVGELLQLGTGWRCGVCARDGGCGGVRLHVQRPQLRVAGSRRRFMTAVQSLLRPALIAESCPALPCPALPCPALPCLPSGPPAIRSRRMRPACALHNFAALAGVISG